MTAVVPDVDGLCVASHHPEWWIGDPPDRATAQTWRRKALAICAVCPAKQQCLDDALSERTDQWFPRGGLGRLALARERKARNAKPSGPTSDVSS